MRIISKQTLVKTCETGHNLGISEGGFFFFFKFLTQFLQRSGFLEKDEEIIEANVLHLSVTESGRLAEGSKVEVK